MEHEKKVTETLRITAWESEPGTLTGNEAERLSDGPDPEPKRIHEIVMDSAPDKPVWLDEAAFTPGDNYEVSVDCAYPVNSPEEAALSLLSWLQAPESANVRVKDSHGVTWTVSVDWIDGVATACLLDIATAKPKVVGTPPPQWPQLIMERAAEARLQQGL